MSGGIFFLLLIIIGFTGGEDIEDITPLPLLFRVGFQSSLELALDLGRVLFFE